MSADRPTGGDQGLSEGEREWFTTQLRQNLGYAISPIIAATLCGHVDTLLAARADKDAAAIAAVRAIAEEWATEGPSLVQHAHSNRDVHEGSMLASCANDIFAALDDGDGGA